MYYKLCVFNYLSSAAEIARIIAYVVDASLFIDISTGYA